MADLMQRARELLAQEYEASGYADFIGGIRDGTGLGEGEEIALRAIVRALQSSDEPSSGEAMRVAIRLLNESGYHDAASALAAANLAGGDGEDARRYRWIRERAERMEAEHEYWLPTVGTIHFQPGAIRNLVHETLDAAIDAAMTRSKDDANRR